MTSQPPAPIAYADAARQGLPMLSVEQMDSLLQMARPHVSGPGRVLIVCRFEGTALTGMKVIEGGPEAGSGEDFKRDCRRLWENYEVGAVVPVVMARAEPAPFAGLVLARLPWGPAAPEGWCARCGRRLLGAGNAHACP